MKELYSFDGHSEHRAQLKKWNDKHGIAVGLDCTPMDDEDREISRVSVKGIYEAANLVAPPPERIVFVSSPLVAQLAGGFAAAIWWLRENPNSDLAKMSEFETNDAIEIATCNATNYETRAIYFRTYNATRNATEFTTHLEACEKTRNATHIATHDATRLSTRVATYDAILLAKQRAIGSATQNETSIATRLATLDKTENATNLVTRIATFDDATLPTRISTSVAIQRAIGSEINADLPESEKVLVSFFLECAKSASSMWQGGNEWAGWGSYISFFREIAKLNLPEYANWKHWGNLELHSGIRMVHKEFCIISDRPEFIKMDENNQPHCVDGPFKKYRDGWSLYYINGVAVERERVEK